jgi:hypothetical protein
MSISAIMAKIISNISISAKKRKKISIIIINNEKEIMASKNNVAIMASKMKISEKYQ